MSARDKAMEWLVIAACVFCLFLAVLCRTTAHEETLEIRTERIMANPTPVPVPVETWMRYPVPLDDELQKYIELECREYGIPASIVFAIIGVESEYDASCIGDGGSSYGLMQVWATEHHDRCLRLYAYNLLDPYQNVRVGIDYLAELISPNWYDGNWYAALAFYNNDTTGKYASRVLSDAELLIESAQVVTEYE